MRYFSIFILFMLSTTVFATEEYTQLDAKQYKQTVANARSQITTYLDALKSRRSETLNAQVGIIANSLVDIPYMSAGAMGEGDWDPESVTYKPSVAHIDQDPVYRLDGLDCQTLVQMVMGLLYSSDLNSFDGNIVKIAYGAINKTGKDQIHYYNRNHFVDANFNPVNQAHGYLKDVTSTGPLSAYAKTTTAHVSLYDWLAMQRTQPEKYVRVLHASDAIFMLKVFMIDYQDLDIDLVQGRDVKISYIPKASLAIKTDDGYQPNQALLDMIPTPAIAEIICDATKWTIGGRNIKDVIGTQMSVSHFGLLYRKTFNQGDVIYQRIDCQYKRNTSCEVTPVKCNKTSCTELMFTHATDGYPSRFYWYQQSDNSYTCTAKRPKKGVKYSMCNRVESLPFYNYITNNQSGSYWYMNTPSILGVHIEKLMPQ